MNVCPVCEAANPAATIRCLGCREPLDARPEPEARHEPAPLPPLPDGGLASAMPDWLLTDSGPGSDGMSDRTAPEPAPGSPNPYDPATFLTEEDLPAWLRALAAEPEPAAGRPPLARATMDGLVQSQRPEAAAAGGAAVQATATSPAAATAIPMQPVSERVAPVPNQTERPPLADTLAPGPRLGPPDEGDRDLARPGAPLRTLSAAPASTVTPEPSASAGLPHAAGSEHLAGAGSSTRETGSPVSRSVHGAPVHRPPVAAPRPRRRVGAWLPALLVLLLVAAAALLVVQSMPGG